MKRLWQGVLYLCMIAGLFACAAPQQTVTTEATQPTAKVPSVVVGELPCATMDGAEVQIITYPAESLYRSGAALPKIDGLACLDVLAAWIKPFAGTSWQVDVSGEDGHGFDPEKLAAKRQELLQRYFQRKGIDTAGWRWQVTVDQEFQLQLTGSP